MENNNFPPENWLSILSLKQSVSWATWKKTCWEIVRKHPIIIIPGEKKKKKVTAIIYDETFLFKKSEFK